MQRSQLKRLDVVFPALHGTHGEDGRFRAYLNWPISRTSARA